MDTLTPAERSAIMARVRGKNTRPELAVRRLAHGMGYRYRLHRRDLPGAPDLVFRSRRKVVFVHGCFWHRHPRCPNTRTPKSRVAFWTTKLTGNRKRDLANLRRLASTGWRALVIWECELRHPDDVRRRLRAFLEGRGGR
jgi:DNA mismatch endonuclease (patch repair protein)